MCVMPEQMFWSSAADRVVRRMNRWRQEFVVCVDVVELRRLRSNLLPDTARLAFLESLFS
jgi:hypothetical protein